MCEGSSQKYWKRHSLSPFNIKLLAEEKVIKPFTPSCLLFLSEISNFFVVSLHGGMGAPVRWSHVPIRSEAPVVSLFTQWPHCALLRAFCRQQPKSNKSMFLKNNYLISARVIVCPDNAALLCFLCTWIPLEEGVKNVKKVKALVALKKLRNNTN